jgi:hypothetical protein
MGHGTWGSSAKVIESTMAFISARSADPVVGQ